MYLDRFGLKRPPFEETANPDFFFETDAMRSVMSDVRKQVAGDGGIVLIEGQSGAGKTMLAQILAQQLQESACILAQINSRDESERALARIATVVNVAVAAGNDTNEQVSRLIEELAARDDRPGVVLIDDAEELGADDLLALQQLIKAAASRKMKLVVVLISTSAIKTRLRLPEVRDFASSMHRTPQLFHPDRSDTAEYIETRLNAAGATSTEIFTTAAVDRIAELSRGKMRIINALAHAAMERAAEKNCERVDVDLIEAIEESRDEAAAPAQAALEQKEPDRSSRNAARLPDPSELTRMERIVERFAELTEYAPQRIGALDSALDRLNHRADDVFQDATRHIGTLEELCNQYGRSENTAAEQLPQLEELTISAGQLHQRLSDIVENLSDVDASSQERIALLLSGLDSAEEIHNKLESAGVQVTGLIEESRRAALAEREALVGIFDQLSARREELSTMIDGMRHHRQKALEENEQAIAEMIDRCRSDAAKACEVSAKALSQARSSVDANRAQLAEDAACANEALNAGREMCDRVLDQVRAVEADIEQRKADLTKLFERQEKRSRDLADIDRKSEALAVKADVAAERLGATVGRADRVAEKIAKDLDQADHLRQSSVTTIERLHAESVAAIEERAEKADQQLRDALARFETLVATEQTARAAADDAVKAARTALASVQQSESRLSEAQSAAIDIEATASAALSAVQQQIKRFEDSVGVIVQHGVDKARAEITTMLDACTSQAAGASDALAQAVTSGVERVQAEVATATEKSDALKTVVEIAVRHAQNEISQIVKNAQGEHTRINDEIVNTLEMSKTESLETMAQARLEVIEQHRGDIETTAQAAMGRFCEEVADRQCAATAAIELAGDRTRATVVQAGDELISTAREKILSAATGAAQTLESEINAANGVADQLTQVVAGAEKLLADARTTREQIDHQIRDVWSLTETTDQRARSLAALAGQAETSESKLTELLADATRRATMLTTQSDVAKKSIEVLTAQQAQVKETCMIFGERITEARKVCAEVAAANETGKKLDPQLKAHSELLQGLLSEASAIIENIQSEADTARTTTVTVEQMGTLVAALDSKVIELQESLANPMSIIQEARGQADELNEICLAVKRVFRGVSEASLQANDRIKMLGKLLVATERSARTMKQWVEHATATQSRLADTIAQAPSINDTHPLVALPAGADLPTKFDDRGINIPAGERATINRAAGKPDRATIANASAGGHPIAATAVTATSSMEKTVEPLAKVLKARQAQGGKAPSPRLTPADVQQLIDAAHQAEAGE